jgi:hypothetical protein
MAVPGSAQRCELAQGRKWATIRRAWLSREATSSDEGIAYWELTGRLLLANSTIDDSWNGQIAGLAIYDRELTPTEVSKHFQGWISHRGNSMMGDESLIALYVFDERAGSTVHNRVDPNNQLDNTWPVLRFASGVPAFNLGPVLPCEDRLETLECLGRLGR